MPIYDFQCPCGKVEEHYAGMDETERKCACGATQKRIISSRYFIHPDLDYVTDNITGEPVRVKSRKHLKQLCEEHGVTQKIGKGWW